MKVLMAATVAHFAEELRAEFPDVTFELGGSADEQAEQVRDAEVYFGGLTRDVFRAAERLRWVQNAGTGIDWIAEVPEMHDSDVVLTNCRGAHAGPLADHVFGMVLALAHRLRDLLEDQKAHRWDRQKYDGTYVELSGKTMGIFALGDIGMAVARRAHGFGMEVYAVDKYPKPTQAEVNSVWGMERLDRLLAISDWFVVTAPLTPETHGLIDRRRMGLLKQGAHVIVISRGNIIDEDALVDGLRSGRIAGAGLDVMAQEPLPADSPLWDVDNILLSPHASGCIPELKPVPGRVFKENLRRFLAGEPLLNVCDKKAGF